MSQFKAITHVYIKSALALAAVSLLVTGCAKENDEDRQIAAGVACLDSAKTSSDADVCLAKVAGNSSAQAYMVRCSANLIAQGFTGSRIASAFQKLKDTPSGASNQSAQMMSYFVFKSITNHSAADAVTNCTASGSKGLITLANTAKVATVAVQAMNAGGIPANLDPSNPSSFDPAALQSTLSNLYNNASSHTDDVASIGAAVVSLQSSACGAGSSLSTQDVCKRINTAISSAASSSSFDVGYAILNQLKNAQ